MKPLKAKTKKSDKRYPINGPIRSWQEVMREFNRRNPSQPFKSSKTVQACGTRALKKLYILLKEEYEDGDFSD